MFLCTGGGFRPPRAQQSEGNCCPICYDDCASTGPHRLIGLACGHTFGSACIEGARSPPPPSPCRSVCGGFPAVPPVGPAQPPRPPLPVGRGRGVPALPPASFQRSDPPLPIRCRHPPSSPAEWLKQKRHCPICKVKVCPRQTRPIALLQGDDAAYQRAKLELEQERQVWVNAPHPPVSGSRQQKGGMCAIQFCAVSPDFMFWGFCRVSL